MTNWVVLSFTQRHHINYLINPLEGIVYRQDKPGYNAMAEGDFSSFEELVENNCAIYIISKSRKHKKMSVMAKAEALEIAFQNKITFNKIPLTDGIHLDNLVAIHCRNLQ
eukprot:TRINITY_DN214_c0_g2_i16.p1 TRINITY_DN214_c0_g2~~TRINITY_DN214_c0_g2_i16.p1  ORF type:complete len:110 (-),score=6.54 TRINITY_DN214_c0_g2_i16:178-507(-)